MPLDTSARNVICLIAILMAFSAAACAPVVDETNSADVSARSTPRTTADPVTRTLAATPTVPATVTSTASPTVVAETPSPSPDSPLPSTPAAQVEVIVPKDVYEVGEQIEWTVFNHLERLIYYRYDGCDFPFIFQWVNGEPTMLVTNILDYEPYVEEIEPGGSLTCVWDQHYYRTGREDPEIQNHRYQIRFRYALTEEGVDVADALHTVRSEVFRIE